jgi:hypothetical protein
MTTTNTPAAAAAARDERRRLSRIRATVRLTLTLGVAVSVVANVLHADPNPISQAIAAWAPLALLLAVELISRVPVHQRGRAWLRIAATTTIATIAAWVSYWHMVGVAVRYGETGPTPYLLPISVDGLIIVASISLIELGARIRHLQPTTTTPTIAGSGTTAPVTGPVTTNPPEQPPPTITRKAPGRPAVTIPAATANRLAATFTRPAPTPPPAPAPNHRAGTAVQESLL